jgi:hypothetical protein
MVRNKPYSFTAVLATALAVVGIGVQAVDPFDLIGVDYREQELQKEKTNRFKGEKFEGLSWVSMSGGTHIAIKSKYLDPEPSNNKIFMYSHELKL